ncbi:MAG: hypothetical protein KDI83_09790 [Gammaproteobacteria bacterium]|nr:hypothetical protein [Gammaproteobacteria bacterium]
MTLNEWEKEHKRLRTMWVVATLFFWFSFCFQGVLYFMDGSLNLVLLSIIGGMLVIGITLKIRLHRHVARRERAK